MKTAINNAERCSQYYKKNKEERLKKQKEYYYKNREARLQYVQEQKERRKQYMSVWQKENKHVCNAHSSKRRALKLSATPPWMSPEDFKKIEEMYELAKAASNFFEIKYHVDHIVPLKGKNVCGLHVPWNLQVLTAFENISKGNRMNTKYEDGE
jgi:5-methylcytosine-specific restriction endonuclease McrA